MAADASGNERGIFVYVGTFTEPPFGRAEGIYVCQFNAETGALRLVQTVANVPDPAYLTLDRNERYLYAVNHLEAGEVSAFARDPQTGKLRFLNRQLAHGAASCYVSLDATGRYALVANYTGGTIAALPITADGSLEAATSVIHHEGSSVNPRRQEGPHPHMIAPTPDGRFVLATDLGTDRIMVYRLDAGTGKLLPNDRGPAFGTAEPGAGPRHFAFTPNGRTLYVINELGSTLTVYDYDGERGELRAHQTVSSLPGGFTGENSCAHVAVSPDGRFVYGSNRGHDSIAIWAIEGATGEVTPVGHESTRGRTPRNFAIDPTGTWLLAANQDTDTIVTFRVDQTAGTLTATGPVAELPSPVAIVFTTM